VQISLTSDKARRRGAGYNVMTNGVSDIDLAPPSIRAEARPNERSWSPRDPSRECAQQIGEGGRVRAQERSPFPAPRRWL